LYYKTAIELLIQGLRQNECQLKFRVKKHKWVKEYEHNVPPETLLFDNVV